MKQKIVIKLCGMLCCDKGRSKAMSLAAATCGVDSVAIDGKDRDELVVVGDCVDPVELTVTLRRKMHGRAELLQVAEVKKDDKKPPPPPPAKPTPPPVTVVCHHCCHPVGNAYYHNYQCYCYCHFH